MNLTDSSAGFGIALTDRLLAKPDAGNVFISPLSATLMLARRRHPGGSNRLDDLCTRYGIDNSRRTKHGALLDAELLAEIYLELIGGRQASLVLVETGRGGEQTRNGRTVVEPRAIALAPRLSDAEREAHARFVTGLGDKAIWLDYGSARSTAEAARGSVAI